MNSKVRNFSRGCRSGRFSPVQGSGLPDTDCGLDNFTIFRCRDIYGKALIDTIPVNALHADTFQMSEIRQPSPATSGVFVPPTATPSMSALGTKMPGISTPSRRPFHIHVAAIDNPLSSPHEYPRGWRSFTYGWLFLPVSIIGRPFGEGTRNHFLPLLTLKSWWEETSWQLRQLFALDPDFHPKMSNVCPHSDREASLWLLTRGVQKQPAAIKGQAWNIVQALKHEVSCSSRMPAPGTGLTVLQDEGPLELTRRQKVLG